VQQAYKIFRFAPLLTLRFSVFVERSDSTERPRAPSVERRWQRSGSLHRVEQNRVRRDLLAHEFTHSWNGKFRRPADLWNPQLQSADCRIASCGCTKDRPNIGVSADRPLGPVDPTAGLDQLALTAAYYKSNQAVAGAPCRIRPMTRSSIRAAPCPGAIGSASRTTTWRAS